MWYKTVKRVESNIDDRYRFGYFPIRGARGLWHSNQMIVGRLLLQALTEFYQIHLLNIFSRFQ